MTILRIDGNYAYLISRATPKLLAILGGIEGRRSWLNGGTQLKVESTKHNIDLLLSMGDVEVETVGKIIPELEEFAFTEPYKEKTKSLPHQIRCKEKMKDKKIFALFLDRGAGKSKLGLDFAGELYHQGKITGVMITSKRGVHKQWILSQAPQHLGTKWSGVCWPCSEEQFPKKGLQLFAINIDALNGKRGMHVAEEFCKRHKGRLLIICDESQDIKNEQSSRHKALSSLRHYSSHRLIATGTPISVSLLDEKNQIDWLDAGIIGMRYKTTFKREFCITGGFAGRAIIGYRNIEKFRSLVDPYVFRVTQEEFGVLPPLEDEWVIDLLPVQKEAIKEIKSELEITIENKTIDISTALVAMSKVQQIASGFMKHGTDQVHYFMPLNENPRLNAAVEWIQAGEDSKAIIWAMFVEDNKMLAARLREENISYAQYYGATSAPDREAAIQGFLDPKGAQVLIANQASASAGLNLQGLCNRALFYSNSFKYIDRVQAEARINRIGTIGAVINTDLIARGTTDRSIVANLKRKQGISQMALGDLLNVISSI